jgi:hypothetical protein
MQLRETYHVRVFVSQWGTHSDKELIWKYVYYNMELDVCLSTQVMFRRDILRYVLMSMLSEPPAPVYPPWWLPYQRHSPVFPVWHFITALLHVVMGSMFNTERQKTAYPIIINLSALHLSSTH